VELFVPENPVDLSNFVSNGEWELISVRAVRNQITYPCCPEHFPDITFYIHIRRRTLYYTYNVIVPCVMLSMLTLSGFWMRPDSGEKVTLGLTVLLAFSVFMLLVAENMPATSSFVPLIGTFLYRFVLVCVCLRTLNLQSIKQRIFRSTHQVWIPIILQIIRLKRNFFLYYRTT